MDAGRSLGLMRLFLGFLELWRERDELSGGLALECSKQTRLGFLLTPCPKPSSPSAWIAAAWSASCLVSTL